MLEHRFGQITEFIVGTCPEILLDTPYWNHAHKIARDIIEARFFMWMPAVSQKIQENGIVPVDGSRVIFALRADRWFTHDFPCSNQIVAPFGNTRRHSLFRFP